MLMNSRAGSRPGFTRTRSRSVRSLRRAIKKLPSDRPVDNPRVWYRTQKEHWLGWLSEYDGPGAYKRKGGAGRDAEFAYNHIVEPKMLLYLARQVKVVPHLLKDASKAAERGGTMMQRAGAMRRIIPWTLIAMKLWR